MEILIVICLLIVIALLLQDKIIINKRKKQNPTLVKQNLSLPDIMGQPKQIRRLLVTNSAKKSQNKEMEKHKDNFDIDVRIASQQLDDVLRNMPDLEEEEEEWNRYGISSGDNGFAQGVTFEELSYVGMLLEKEKLESSQKETAIAIVQKIQGTELLTLLEDSMESASRKIAELLDGSISSEAETGSSNLQKNDISHFDIGEFI
jgi:hypothetical protein